MAVLLRAGSCFDPVTLPRSLRDADGDFAHPALGGQFVGRFPKAAFVGNDGIEHVSAIERLNGLGAQRRAGKHAARVLHHHGALDLLTTGRAFQAAQIAEQLGESIKIGQRDDLADFGIGIAAGTAGAEKAACKNVAACAKAFIGLGRLAFGNEFLRRLVVDDFQREVS